MSSIFGSAGIGAAQGLLGSGGMQGMTLEELQHQQLANEYQQALAQSMMNTKQAVAQQVYKGQGVHATTRVKPFNPNEDAAYNIPLSQLITLWQANYGDQWVERFDDDFWASARMRLHANDKLEATSGWYRIKEDA